MANSYRTIPQDTTGMPSGIPYIVGNEAAERFSFYGMRAILFVFMTKYLMDAAGEPAVMNEAQAKAWGHMFQGAVYFFPILGAIIADAWWGKYRTIIYVSIVYCLGHLALAVDDTRLGLAIGLSLIAIGSGGIKPCVSANVGDQFGPTNQGLIEKVYNWFYFSINVGSTASTLLTPVLLDRYGPSMAFGVPGILMFLATLIFWMGQREFVHRPPVGTSFVRQAFRGEGLKALRNLVPIYLCIVVWWSLYEQSSLGWVAQAGRMNRDVDLEPLRNWGLSFLPSTWTILESQVQAINPILVLVFIPTFSYLLYPTLNRLIRMTALRKIGLGFFLMIACFAIIALIERSLVAGYRPHIGWQCLAYAVLTASEVMVYATGLEFSYTQAPSYMKSFIMSLYLLTVAGGDGIAFLVNTAIQRPDGSSRLEGPSYFWFFCLLMLAATIAFVFVALRYQGKTYLQGDDEAQPASA
ncbi:MAG: POT family MFS transporter [Pirellulales bacterium]